MAQKKIKDSMVYKMLVSGGGSSGGGGGGGGIIPAGTIEINQNGRKDVTQYAYADVQVPPYGEGDVEINSNGTHDVSGKARAVVNVPSGGITPSGTVDIAQNGVTDVAQYASANVQVPPYGEGEVDIVANGPADVSGKATANVNVPPYGEGEVEIVTNGRHNVSGKATAVVNVPESGITPSGVIEINSNGDHDVTQYATARVSVPTGGGGQVNTKDPAAVYAATRPADWMPMPDPADGEIYMLALIGENESGYFCFSVDTTDGSQYNVYVGHMSGGSYVVDATHQQYSGSEIRIAVKYSECVYNTHTSDGYAQVLLKVSGSIKKFSGGTYGINGTAGPIVDMVAKATSADGIYPSGQNYPYSDMPSMRYFRLIGSNNISDATYMFSGCVSLVCAQIDDTSHMTKIDNMCNKCRSLVSISDMTDSAIQTAGFAFSDCSALTYTPGINTAECTDVSYMFQNCMSLREAYLDFGAASSFYSGSVFQGCASLRNAALKIRGKYVQAFSMFSSCYSLSSVSVEAESESVPGINIDMSTCPVSAESIRAMIASLPTATDSPTITVTNCPEASLLTADDISAAAAKGWTLTTGMSTYAEYDIPDDMAMSIITGEVE